MSFHLVRVLDQFAPSGNEVIFVQVPDPPNIAMDDTSKQP